MADTDHRAESVLAKLPSHFAPMPAVMRTLARFDRPKLEGFISVAIGLLDVMDGEPDAEESDPAEEDGCNQDAAWLERVDQSRRPLPPFADHWSGLGASEDAEDDDPRELNGDEGDYSDGDCGHCAHYGIDQTKPLGPDNPEAA